VDISGSVDDDAEARVLSILAGTVPGVAHVELHRVPLHAAPSGVQ